MQYRPPGRTPQGVRGLKFGFPCHHPDQHRRTPQGVRGLKSVFVPSYGRPRGRTPQGVRGLKSVIQYQLHSRTASHPARGAWIEISFPRIRAGTVVVAPRKGNVD